MIFGSLQIVNNLLSIEGSLLSDDSGFVDANGSLYFPKVTGAEISVPPVISVANPKKRPRPDENLASHTNPLDYSRTNAALSSPMPDASAAPKKRKLKEPDTPSEKRKDKKHKDKKEKEKKSKHKVK